MDLLLVQPSFKTFCHRSSFQLSTSFIDWRNIQWKWFVEKWSIHSDKFVGRRTMGTRKSHNINRIHKQGHCPNTFFCFTNDDYGVKKSNWSQNSCPYKDVFVLGQFFIFHYFKGQLSISNLWSPCPYPDGSHHPKPQAKKYILLFGKISF